MTTQCQQILANGNPIDTSDIERSTSRLASHIAPLLHQMTSMKGFNYQQLAMEKLLKQPVVQGAMLDEAVNSKKYETTIEIVDNMRRGCRVSKLIIILMR